MLNITIQKDSTVKQDSRFMLKLEKLAIGGNTEKLAQLKKKNKDNAYLLQFINEALRKACAHKKAINRTGVQWLGDASQPIKFYGIKHNL